MSQSKPQRYMISMPRTLTFEQMHEVLDADRRDEPLPHGAEYINLDPPPERRILN